LEILLEIGLDVDRLCGGGGGGGAATIRGAGAPCFIIRLLPRTVSSWSFLWLLKGYEYLEVLLEIGLDVDGLCGGGGGFGGVATGKREAGTAAEETSN
jgi:hypothetical protein